MSHGFVSVLAIRLATSLNQESSNLLQQGYLFKNNYFIGFLPVYWLRLLLLKIASIHSLHPLLFLLLDCCLLKLVKVYFHSNDLRSLIIISAIEYPHFIGVNIFKIEKNKFFEISSVIRLLNNRSSWKDMIFIMRCQLRNCCHCMQVTSCNCTG